MNKLLTFISVPLLATSLNKCVFFTGEVSDEEKISRNNPGYILKRTSFNDYKVDVNEYSYKFTYEESQDLVNNYIPSESHFYNVERDTVDLTGDMFSLDVSRSILMWGRESHTMQFYRNGYVKVSSYYYKFDETVANRLYNKVYAVCDAHHKEELDKEAEYNKYDKEIDKFSLDEMLNVIKDEDPFIYQYSNLSTTSYVLGTKFKDDGEIKELILNATYTPTSVGRGDGSIYGNTISFGKNIKDEQNEEKDKVRYSYSIDENGYLVTIYKVMFDKYDREYSKVLYLNLTRETTHAIFDKVIATYEESERVRKEYSAATDNFTIEDVVDDIKEQDPLSFYYQEQSYYPEYKRHDITDDGGVKDVLINATYPAYNYVHDSEFIGIVFEGIGITKEEKDEEGNVYSTYTCTIWRGNHVVELIKTMHDKYDRSYESTKYYDIGKDTCDTLFLKVLTLYEAQKNLAE